MYQIAQNFTLRLTLSFTVCSSLLLLPGVSLLSEASQGQGQGAARSARPRHKKPEGTLPDLEEVKNESNVEREALPPIPSSVRAKRNEGKPWDGRRVGDPGTSQRPLDQPDEERQTRRAHARRRSAPPPLSEDQFVQNFFSLALLRSPTADETLYWNNLLRAGYSQSQSSLKLAAIEFGRTLFESASYAARNRDAHSYVYDLYKTYLLREPDAGGWAYWEALVPANGREYVRRGFEESGEFASLLATVSLSGAASASPASLISARVEPRNQPGNGMLSRDVSWSVPLLSLPGRNGLNLGLALSYSSMVWTRSGPYFYFDEDNGFPSPGFRLGFPTVQRKTFDAQTGKNAYLLITPSGHRVELRQTTTATVYEAADSSYLQLIETGATLLVRSTEGTQLSLAEANNEYRCTQIKDRNGNYLSVTYNAQGQLANITDTLGRVITFNYDSNANLLSITQAWNGQASHQWVSFGWSTRNMQYSFAEATVVGIRNGVTVPVITQVALNDTSYFTFDYTNSLQVSQIKNYFGASERNTTAFTYETPSGDVPRLSSSSVSAQNWTGVNGVPAQVTTQYSVAGDGACVLTAPDGTIYKEYYGTGWQKGLTTLSEIWSGGVKQKWTTTAWTQDNTAVSYEMNPRVVETNVYDASGNRRRTLIDWGGNPQYVQYGLPYGVREYAADGVTEVRQTWTDYNLSQAYLDRRIIGLVSAVHLTNVSSWQGKITYEYDDPARLSVLPAAATQHDSAYNTSFIVRGNVTSVSQWDFTDISNMAKKLTSYTNYFVTGTPASATDPSTHTSTISYTDAFSDGVTRNPTFAYPTTLTDAGGYNSTVQYNYDFGATTRTQSPAPANQPQGTIQTMAYNSLGQLERITTENNSAYKRFWYGPNYVASYTSVNNIADELYAIRVVDGLGRVIGAAGNHPNSTGGYRLVVTVYDQMGRATNVSNLTEVNNSWVASGDDATGLYYTQQTYDWKGRPLVTTNPDSTTTTVSYSGCGCAGGEVVTLTDEVGRRQKVYSDVLGRQAKMEILNWDASVYSTRINTHNVRDQITNVKQYQGLESSGIYQEITKSYDGYGRLVTSKDPIQIANTVITYTLDSQPATVTDARGVTQTFTYNSRELLTKVSYSGGDALSPVTFTYNGVGDRTSMTDATGSRTYQYNQLSQLTSETRKFTGLSGSFTLSYEYNLVGALTSITDYTGSRVDYLYNSAAALTTVNGSSVASAPSYLSNIAYRASGAIKDFDFGNGTHQHLNFDARLRNTSLTLSNGSLNVTWDHEYYSDGKLKKITDSNNAVFDRAFDYDHVGRLREARTGSEARGNTTADGPFKQTYGYDVWENTTSRNYRLWTATPQNESVSFTNNRRQYWSYDNEGHLTSDLDALYSYDAAGRQKEFKANVYVGGWPTSYPTESVMEVTQTFDGNSAPAKKTTINRWEELVGEEVQVQQSTTTSYFLQSTVLGGKVVAELGDTGTKQLGYIYAGGMLVATQYIYIGGSSVGWISTSPATGSEYMTDMFVARRELDPLGADVTTSPLPGLVSEPVFYHPKFDQMPLEIEGGPSEEYQRANQAWANEMLAAFYLPQVEDLWQAGKVSAAMRLLANNPNLGIEYRVFVKNEFTRRGSYFGQDAADFLLGINIAVGMGLLSPITGQGNSLSQKIRVGADDLKEYRARIDGMLRNENCLGYIMNLLNEVKTQTGKAYGDILTTFDAMRFYWAKTDGAHGGYSYWEDMGKVKAADIMDTIRTERIGGSRANQMDRRAYLISETTQAFLGETLHHVSQSGRMYEDAEMANALNALLVRKGLDTPRVFSESTVTGMDNASRYWHLKVQSACPAPRK